ncbi:uncharacterized protein TOT_030000237 [Theileria orientalis strain Shintoku]|uniref:Midasin n=1 Tax=Theileria orientalis strain Shintoku TaxID=869250 RepID=J4C3T0_THEOR|nr:uncharacterized protein TOT_030000237 [Theileria orientalis strain Shintoku]BAM40976.1 uncharacterized protein TOT_030000237 [Theileria orientalis strain Shintoku]|eukprot:XP_009691277.1 uncharacterized protein TOT_030000237 [Theileria orientalis strain Shintoku]
MDNSTILFDSCKIIINKLRLYLSKKNRTNKRFDWFRCKTLFVELEQLDECRNIQYSYITLIYSDSFYDEYQFANIFNCLFTWAVKKYDTSYSCKINISLLLLVSCLLNYKLCHVAFDFVPDIALNLTIEILESFSDDNDYVVEIILLAHRLRNDFRIGRLCTKFLRELKHRKNVSRKINDLITLHKTTPVDLLIERLRILSNLSDVLALNDIGNLITYSKLHKLGTPSFEEPAWFLELKATEQFRELCELSESMLNNEKTKLKVPGYCMSTSFRRIKMNRRSAPNLIQTHNHVSYLRERTSRRKWLGGAMDDYHPGPVEEGYVVLDFSEQVIANLLFSIDVSMAVMVCGECKNYYLRLLARRLGIDPSKVNNVYTDETTDVKSLVGNWVSREKLGEFTFSYGVLARAMKEGRWLIFDSYISDTIYSFLVDVCSSGRLNVPELNEKIYAHENFQVFIIPYSNNTKINELMRQLVKGQLSIGTRNTVTSGTDYLFGGMFNNDEVPLVNIPSPTSSDVLKICETLYPNENIKELVVSIYSFETTHGEYLKVTISKMVRLFNRIYTYLTVAERGRLTRHKTYMGDEIKMLLLYEFYNVFVCGIEVKEVRVDIMTKMAHMFGVIIHSLEEVLDSFRLIEPILESIIYELMLEKKVYQTISQYNGHNADILKMIYMSFVRKEPVLLVGETGTGKTALVQKFAEITGNTLKVFVFSENSDSTDLIGSYYPVEEGEEPAAKKGIRFKFCEGILLECIRNGYWLLLDEINLAQQDLLYKLYSLVHHVYEMNNRRWRGADNADHNGTRGSDSMEFYEYMDKEVPVHKNFRLFSCMNPAVIRKNEGYKVNTGKKELPETFSKVFTTIYVDPISTYDALFNVATCYTRNLTRNVNLRELCLFYLKITELVDRCEIEDGSLKLPNFTLRNFVRSVQYIVNLATREFRPITDVNKLMYDSIRANFLSTLGTSSVQKALEVLPPIISEYSKEDYRISGNAGRKSNSAVASCCKKYIKIYGYWVKLGASNGVSTSIGGLINREREVENISSDDYVLCKNNLGYMIKLVRILSGSRVPILLQGPTAAGKTSLVKYLCKLTNHTCVRINNHEHTDITEYIGQHHFQGGRMVFEYGTLVVAMKYGYWVILDELNLASSEILECLNRILDDNREIYISETNETIKCHEDFMIFATQNPSDSIYGGRKQLSRSFTNRFIQLFFDEISNEDLKTILHKRCQIPLTKSEIVVSLYQKIRSVTINSILFQKNQILITTRDLIKLANRIRDQYSKEQMLVHYYSLIAEKLYNDKEKESILSILNEYFYASKESRSDGEAARTSSNAVLNESRASGTSAGSEEKALEQSREKRRKLSQKYTICDVEQEYVELLRRGNGTFDVEDLKRFFVANDYYWIEGYTDRIVYLIMTALANRENVLLVGETGIGKTTIVQLLAKFLSVKLNIFNCNQNTEASDFIGSICPTTETRSADELFKWVDGPLINSMVRGEWFLLDEISLTEDSVLEKINSVLEFESYIVLNQTILSTGNSTMDHDGSANEQIRCVYSHKDFRLFGAMNPGNDYGKKELSPSLSNRFTQIYVPPIPITDLRILTNIIKYHNDNRVIEDWFVNSTKEIIERLMARNGNGENYITIRNLIMWSNYYFRTLDAEKSDKGFIYMEGLQISILNSYKEKPIDEKQIYEIVGKYAELSDQRDEKQPETVESKIESVLLKSYYSLNYISVLLEGNPGVGKTYGVYKLAERLKRKLIRVNLNEYTDMSDLLGTYVPGNSESEVNIGAKKGFKWVNGPLLECMINGYWLLLDELNLASSEILEGLNSVLDHRRDLYIPQLNMSLKCHEDFRIFATQNTVTATNYRKHMPRSFLNRFIRLSVPDLTYKDYQGILARMFPEHVGLIGKYVNFIMMTSSKTAPTRFGQGQPRASGLWNLRDLINIFKLIGHYGELRAIEVIANASEKESPKERKRCRKYMNRIYDNEMGGLTYLVYLDYLQIYNDLLSLHQFKLPILIIYNSSHLNYASNVVKSFHRLVQAKAPNTCCRKGRLKSVKLYNNSDINDLLGSYEQVNEKYAYNCVCELYEKLTTIATVHYTDLYHQFIMSEYSKEWANTSSNVGTHDHSNIETENKTRNNFGTVSNVKDDNSDGGDEGNIAFKWIDSDIIRAIESGDWVLINDIHLVSSSLMDRLNSLLEPTRDMNVNECGYNRNIKVNEDFRIFFTVQEEHIDRLTDSFLNRCIQINLNTVKVLNTTKSLLLSSIYDPFISENRELFTGQLRCVQMYEFYNALNIVRNVVKDGMFFEKSLTELIFICLVFVFMKNMYQVKKMLLVYFVRYYENVGKLKEAFNSAWSLYAVLNSYEDNTIRGIGVKLIEYLMVRCHPLKALTNKHYLLLREFIEKVLSKKISIDEQMMVNDVELTKLYEEYYPDSIYGQVWHLQKGIRHKKDRRHYSLFALKENMATRVLYHVYSQEKKVTVKILKLFMVLLSTNEELEEIIGENMDLVLKRDEELVNTLHFLDFVTKNIGEGQKVASANQGEDGNAENTAQGISIGKIYIINKSLSKYKYVLDFDVKEKFSIIKKFDMATGVKPLDVGLERRSREVVIQEKEELILEKFVLKRVMFLINRLFHDHFVESEPNVHIMEYFGELNGVIEVLNPGMSQHFTTTVRRIAATVKRFYETSEMRLLFEVLCEVYVLYNHYHHDNAGNGEREEMVSYLRHMLFPESTLNPVHKNEEEQINHETSLSSLVENVNRMKLIEYLNRFSHALCYYTFLFMQLLYNAPYIKHHLFQLGLKVDLEGFIRCLYRKIMGVQESSESVNKTAVSIATITLFLRNNPKKGDIHEVCSTTNDKLQSAMLLKLHDNMVHFSLLIVPHVSEFLRKLESYHRNRFMEYEKQQMRELYLALNILDSLSMGYALNNKYLYDYVERLYENKDSVPLSKIERVNDDDLDIVVDFIVEYDKFKAGYLKLQNPFNYHATKETADEAEMAGLICGNKKRVLEAIRNFISHVATKYAAIKEVIQHPIMVLHSMLFHYHLTEVIRASDPKEDHMRWENYISLNNTLNKFNPVLKTQFVSHRNDGAEFSHMIQLYLFCLAHNKRNYFVCAYSLLSLNVYTDFNYYDIMQTTFYYHFLQSHNFDHLVLHSKDTLNTNDGVYEFDSRLGRRINEGKLLLSVTKALNSLNYKITEMLSIYGNDPILTDIQAFVSGYIPSVASLVIMTVTNFNLKNLTERSNIANMLMNLASKLNHLASISTSDFALMIRTHETKVKELVESYKTMRMEDVKEFNEVILENHKLLQFDLVFRQVLTILMSYLEAIDSNTGDHMSPELYASINEIKNSLINYLFQGGIVGILVMKPVFSTILITLPDCNKARLLSELFEYILFFFKGYEGVVKEYVEELNRSYEEALKAYVKLKEVNCKKAINSYKEGLNIRFMSLYTSRVLVNSAQPMVYNELKTDMLTMLKRNYEYILNNSNEMTLQQYSRIMNSVFQQLELLESEIKVEFDIPIAKHRTEDGIAYHRFIEFDSIKSTDEVYEDPFVEYNTYMEQSLGYLFRSFNTLHDVGYIVSGRVTNENYNVDLFAKIINERALNQMYKTMNMILESAVMNYNKFNADKFDLLVKSCPNHRTIVENKFASMLVTVNELIVTIKQYLSCTNYSFYLEENEVNNGSIGVPKVEAKRELHSICVQIERRVKSSMEYSAFMSTNKREMHRKKMVVTTKLADDLMEYIDVLEREVYKMVNNIQITNIKKLIKILRSELLLLVSRGDDGAQNKAIVNTNNSNKAIVNTNNSNKAIVNTNNSNKAIVNTSNLNSVKVNTNNSNKAIVNTNNSNKAIVNTSNLNSVKVNTSNLNRSYVNSGDATENAQAWKLDASSVKEYKAGTGLDEGIGIKNISSEVKEDDLNMEDVTRKDETKQEEDREDEMNLDEEDNINVDFDEQGENLEMEKVNEEELAGKDEDELEKMEDDYSNQKDEDDENKNNEEQLETEEVKVGDEVDSENINIEREYKESAESNEELDGYKEDACEDDIEGNDGTNEEKVEEKDSKDYNTDGDKVDGDQDDNNLDDEDTPSKEESAINEDKSKEQSENEGEDEDKDKEQLDNAGEDADSKEQELKEEKSGELQSESTTTYNQEAYGVQNKGYDTIVSDLQQINIRSALSASSYSNEQSRVQSTRIENIQKQEVDEQEAHGDEKERADAVNTSKLIRQDGLNTPSDNSQLFEYFNSKVNDTAVLGLGKINKRPYDDIERLEKESGMEVDDEEEGCDDKIDELEGDRNKMELIQDSENGIVKMDVDTDHGIDVKEEQDRIHVNSDLLFTNAVENVEAIEYLVKQDGEVERSLNLEQLADRNSLIQLSNNLLSQLRIILEYNYVNSLKGYYKHGKRISIKKLMIFIATNYQRDKIWLKRLKPQKRDYFIQIAIDNTKSMSAIAKISIQTIVVIYEAIHKLNIGTLNVIKFGAYTPEVILNNINTAHNDNWMLRLSFDEESKFSYETGLIQLFQFILAQPHFIASKNKILIIISDGKFNKNKVRKYLINIINHNVVPLLVVLDPQNSITNMKHIINTDGRLVIENYLDNFPFPYYSIISNINNLPNILSDLLR